MQFVHFNDYRLGVLAGDNVVDISDFVGQIGVGPQSRVAALIANWQELAPRIAEAAGGGGVSLSSVQLRPSVPKPGQLVCAAVNYIEAGHPEPGPFNAFLKSPTSIIGQGQTVELPDAPVTVFHFEPELALVIGKAASHIKAEEAMDYIFGYTMFIDGSPRGLPGGFFLGKSWHTFAPLGPALVTADEVPEPNNVRVDFTVNGELRQSFSTSYMARHIPELLAELTNVIALEPGDVVGTGVHHEGLGPIQGGDQVSMTIEGFGPALELSVHDAQNRTSWGSWGTR
jgi:2-keto-4-pentenoate hydratase/2-oxohepta-3-ene-1,7-dioic acid hydratase in catechol pathway